MTQIFFITAWNNKTGTECSKVIICWTLCIDLDMCNDMAQPTAITSQEYNQAEYLSSPNQEYKDIAVR